jgi:hypothetical protein
VTRGARTPVGDFCVCLAGMIPVLQELCFLRAFWAGEEARHPHLRVIAEAGQ